MRKLIRTKDETKLRKTLDSVVRFIELLCRPPRRCHDQLPCLASPARTLSEKCTSAGRPNSAARNRRHHTTFARDAPLRLRRTARPPLPKYPAATDRLSTPAPTSPLTRQQSASDNLDPDTLNPATSLTNQPQWPDSAENSAPSQTASRLA